MREIVSDIETTGLSPDDGHRIIEVAWVEIIDKQVTGERLHLFVNPETDMCDEAVDIHGITNHFLEDKPTFVEIWSKINEFIRSDPLVVYNAPFDLGFYNYELGKMNLPELNQGRTVIDTLGLVRNAYPGKRASLDLMCSRLAIDTSNREERGALLDAVLFAEIYLRLTGKDNA